MGIGLYGSSVPGWCIVAVIDPEGLFAGDRMRLLSREAWLLWSFYYLASNGYGRLELNYRKIIGRAFACLPNPPSEKQFWDHIEEYSNAYLMFVYQVGGVHWGQWDTSEKFLPRWKTTEDKESPVPPADSWIQWKSEYADVKNQQAAATAIRFNKFAKTPALLPLGVGVGVGVGIGEGLKTCASRDARRSAGQDIQRSTDEPTKLFELEAQCRPVANQHRTGNSQQESWFGVWWDMYWLKRSRKDAWKVFQKHVKTESTFAKVVEATRAQTPEMLQREPAKRPHGATWLNGERWEDDLEAPASRPAQQISGGLFSSLVSERGRM